MLPFGILFGLKTCVDYLDFPIQIFCIMVKQRSLKKHGNDEKFKKLQEKNVKIDKCMFLLC